MLHRRPDFDSRNKDFRNFSDLVDKGKLALPLKFHTNKKRQNLLRCPENRSVTGMGLGCRGQSYNKKLVFLLSIGDRSFENHHHRALVTKEYVHKSSIIVLNKS
jgi:hypothetical protein